MNRVNTVVSIKGLSVESIVAGGSDIIIFMPCERRLVATNPYGIVFDVIGLVYAQAEAVNTVTSEWGSEMIAVFTGSIQ